MCVMLTGGMLVVRSVNVIDQDKTSLSEFVIGRWVGEFSEGKEGDTFTTTYQLEFIEPDKLILGFRTQDVEQFNLVYHYQFVGKNQISVEARMRDEWQIDRDGKDLVIYTTHGFVENGRYNRKQVIEWPLVSLLIGMALLGLLFVNIRGSRPRKKNPFPHSLLGQDRILIRILRGLVIVVVFGMGLALSRIICYWTPLRMVRIPWDAIITLEIGGAFLVFGTKLVGFNQTNGNSFSFLISGLNNMGIVFLGSGLGCFGFGLFNLAVALFVGYYPTG